MKKIITLILAVSLLSSFAFAKNYKGDLQLNFGGSAEQMNGEKDKVDFKGESGMFEFDVQTWHLFGINDWFSVGFMGGINMGLGSTTKLEVFGIDGTGDLSVAAHMDFLLGPAVGFTIGDVVRFNVTTGLDLGFFNMYSREDPTDSSNLITAYCSPVGFGFQGQAKFLPNAKVSPVVSYRITSGAASKLYTYDQGENETNDWSADSLNVVNSAFTVGVSFNW